MTVTGERMRLHMMYKTLSNLICRFNGFVFLLFGAAFVVIVSKREHNNYGD